jgi:hypothetical protein
MWNLLVKKGAFESPKFTKILDTKGANRAYYCIINEWLIDPQFQKESHPSFALSQAISSKIKVQRRI